MRVVLTNYPIAQSDFSFKESGDVPLTNLMMVDVHELLKTASFKKRNLSGLRCAMLRNYVAVKGFGTIVNKETGKVVVNKVLNVDGTYYVQSLTEKVIFDLSNFNLMFSKILQITNANLDNALIRGAEMSISLEQLYSTYDYNHGKLVDMQFNECNFENGKFTKINFAGTTFGKGCNLKNADFTDSKISWVSFDSKQNVTVDQIKSTTDFKNKKLLHVTIHGVDFSNVDLSGFDLSGSRFRGCNFRNVNCTDAVVTDCNLSLCEPPVSIAQMKSTWNYKNNYMRGIILPEKIQKELDAEKQKNKN
ncbi:MAG: pentapeptide repeat-containing protein [Planctomycetaceae bacterium]|jgi:uncharacterized protein YjbI with pentapeptide repeats|nr:pentapeptide repeat-containing protein [Planctomycetaceae bacterium]